MIQMCWYIPSGGIRSSSISIRFSITNNQDSPLPSDTRLFIIGDGYFISCNYLVGSVEPYMKKDFQLEIAISAYKTIRDFSGEVNAEVRGKGKVIKSVSFHFPHLSSMTQDLRLIRSPYESDGGKLNLLLFGPIGSGKSSLIHTFATLMSNSNEIIRSLTKVAIGTGVHGTTSLRRIRIDGMGCQIWDTWGVTYSNYQHFDIDAIIRGSLPSEWQMDDSLSESKSTLEDGRSTSWQRRQHCVLILIPCGIKNDATMIRSMQDHVRIISSHGINPLFVLVRIDEVIPSIRTKPFCKEGEMRELDELKIWVYDTFNPPMNHIFHVVPYTEENRRNFGIERQAYLLLEEALLCARQYARYNTTSSSESETKRKYSW